jgi:hypothetical protein
MVIPIARCFHPYRRQCGTPPRFSAVKKPVSSLAGWSRCINSARRSQHLERAFAHCFRQLHLGVFQRGRLVRDCRAGGFADWKRQTPCSAGCGCLTEGDWGQSPLPFQAGLKFFHFRTDRAAAFAATAGIFLFSEGGVDEQDDGDRNDRQRDDTLKRRRHLSSRVRARFDRR